MKFKSFIASLLLLIFSSNITPSFAIENVYEKYFLDKLWQDFLELKTNERPTIALVLGGGGTRGFAHIGVLEALEDNKIPIDIVVGTSVGAIVGALYSSGMSIEKMHAIVDKIKWKDISGFSFSSFIGLMLFSKFINTDKMEVFIGNAIENKRFDELNKVFACIATDINTGERIILRDGFVAPAVRASASIPGIFEPVKYRHRLLVDGGIVNNIPVDVAKMLGADIVIAVTMQQDYTGNKLDNAYQVTRQVIAIQSNVINNNILEGADIVISPNVGKINMFDIQDKNKLLKAGLVKTREMVFEIKKLIVEKSNRKKNEEYFFEEYFFEKYFKDNK